MWFIGHAILLILPNKNGLIPIPKFVLLPLVPYFFCFLCDSSFVANLCLDVGSPLPKPCTIDSSYPFCNYNLPLKRRVADLVGRYLFKIKSIEYQIFVRMSTDEKIAQFSNGAGPIPSLHIPPYQWWSEALHGVACIDFVFLILWTSLVASPGVRFTNPTPFATSFPQVILTAGTYQYKDTLSLTIPFPW